MRVSADAILDCRPPGFRTHVPRMTGKQPEVPLPIAKSILQFAIHRFVKLFDEADPGRLGAGKVLLHVLHKDCQGLGAKAQFGGSSILAVGLVHLDAGASEVDLRAGERIAVAIILHEAKRAREPLDRYVQVLVGHVRQDGIGGDGSVPKHEDTIKDRSIISESRNAGLQRLRKNSSCEGYGGKTPGVKGTGFSLRGGYELQPA